MDVWAFHLEHYVEIDLEVVAHAFFHAEGVGLVALPPASEFGEDEEEGDDEHGDGPFSAAGRLGHILGFCFGWRRVSGCFPDLNFWERW